MHENLYQAVISVNTQSPVIILVHFKTVFINHYFLFLDQESISTEHYDKQVFINSTEGSFNYSSAGEILLYLDKMPHWGTVGIGKETNNPFSVNGANAVCRQLGYTSAAYFAKGYRISVECVSCL